MELLAVVHAEQAADALIKEAQDGKEQAIKQAFAEREFKLKNLKTPLAHIPELQPLRPNLEQLKETARRNQQKTISRILEEFYAEK